MVAVRSQRARNTVRSALGLCVGSGGSLGRDYEKQAEEIRAEVKLAGLPLRASCCLAFASAWLGLARPPPPVPECMRGPLTPQVAAGFARLEDSETYMT